MKVTRYLSKLLKVKLLLSLLNFLTLALFDISPSPSTPTSLSPPLTHFLRSSPIPGPQKSSPAHELQIPLSNTPYPHRPQAHPYPRCSGPKKASLFYGILVPRHHVLSSLLIPLPFPGSSLILQPQHKNLNRICPINRSYVLKVG